MTYSIVMASREELHKNLPTFVNHSCIPKLAFAVNSFTFSFQRDSEAERKEGASEALKLHTQLGS
jgi:hypothetical protein